MNSNARSNLLEGRFKTKIFCVLQKGTQFGCRLYSDFMIHRSFPHQKTLCVLTNLCKMPLEKICCDSLCIPTSYLVHNNLLCIRKWWQLTYFFEPVIQLTCICHANLFMRHMSKLHFETICMKSGYIQVQTAILSSHRPTFVSEFQLFK